MLRSAVEERTITGSRGKSLLLLAVSLAFVAFAVAQLRGPPPVDWRVWLTLIFFGLGAIVFAWLLVRPQRLILDAEGFTVAGGLVRAPRRTGWAEVDHFFVYRLSRGGKMIGYNYAQGARPASALRDLGRRFGADGAISKGFPGSPERLVEELNAYRARALAGN